MEGWPLAVCDHQACAEMLSSMQSVSVHPFLFGPPAQLVGFLWDSSFIIYSVVCVGLSLDSSTQTHAYTLSTTRLALTPLHILIAGYICVQNSFIEEAVCGLLSCFLSMECEEPRPK